MKTIPCPPTPEAVRLIEQAAKAHRASIKREARKAPKFRFKVSFELDHRMVKDAIEEAPIGYWGKFTNSARSEVELNPGEVHKGRRRFKVDIHKGLRLLAEKYPQRLKNFLDEDFDGDDEDTLVQLATLGESIYG